MLVRGYIRDVCGCRYWRQVAEINQVFLSHAVLALVHLDVRHELDRSEFGIK